MVIRKDITMCKGDTEKYKLKILDQDGNIIILADGDMLYFTVKENFETKDVIFQKKLGDGITYSEDDNCYHMELNPNDTENLQYKTYVFDVLLVKRADSKGSSLPEKKTLIVGKLIIEYVVTFSENEV